MSPKYPKQNEITNLSGLRWTPRAIKVLSTAKAIAAPVGRIEADRVILDLRTVPSSADRALLTAVRAALR